MNSHLKDLDSAYNNAKADEFEPIPDGTYIMQVDEVEITESKAGNPMLKWKLRIIDGEYTKRIIWRYNMLSTEQNMKWLKIDVEKCGIKLKGVSELPERLGDFLDLKLRIEQKTKGEFTNYYIKGLAQDGAPMKFGKGDEVPF